MSKERFSRRDFLRLSAMTAGFGMAAFGAKYGLISLRQQKQEEQELNNGQKYIERNGVFISGEEKIFNIGDVNYTVKVNGEAFLEVLLLLAERDGRKGEVKRYLARHPLRIALHSNERLFGDRGQYVDRTKSPEPEIQFPSSFLRDYYREQRFNLLAGDPADETVVHELKHFIQDSKENFLKINTSLRSGMMVSTGILYTHLPWLISKLRRMDIESLEDEEKKKLERSFLAISASSGGIGLYTGHLISYLLSPAERQAAKSETLINEDVFEKYTHKFFEFKRLTE